MRWVLLFLTVCQSINFTYASDEDQTDSLKDTFRDSFLIGVAVNREIVTSRYPAAANIVGQQFNSITAENDMKAEVLNPSPGEYNFAPADAFVEFGKSHNMFIIGHTLVWHNQTPAWFFTNEEGKANTPGQQIEQMRKYIQTVAGRYAGKIQAWDVVNEIIDNDGSYRPTSWVRSVGSGDELVKAAFRFAEKYAPDTELYYNDFNAWRPQKRKGIMRMIKMLKQEGIRIDGVGIQGHWGLNFPKNEYIQDAIDAYASLGIKVMITELDIDVLPLTKEGQIIGTGLLHPQYELEEFETFLDPYKDKLNDTVQRKLTDRYKELFNIFQRNKSKIDRVTFWGLHDGMSWKNNYPIQNRTNYPLLYDRSLTPKPAVKAIKQVINH